ncbi:MAG: hypothetical protein JWL67_2168 [Solirubrobacterales bacterium]|nr:hypothetical protein [Solirubrobacterales bacterium]
MTSHANPGASPGTLAPPTLGPPAPAPGRDLQMAEGRAAQIVESASDAVLSTDRSGRIQTWNHAAEELFGFRAAEAIGRPVSLIIPEGLALEHRRLFTRLMAGERIDQYETARLRKDGSTVDVSLTLFSLRDAAGEIVGAASVARDISRRIVAERELRASEKRYRALLEAAYEGVWRVDTRLVTDYVNRSMAEMLGFSVEEMLGRHLSEFVDGDGMRFAEESTRRQSEGAKERLEVTFRCKSHAELHALISVNALFDEHGAYSGNLAMVTDVSEQRRAEARHREIETFLSRVTTSMNEGLLTLDPDGRIASVNPAAGQLLGYEDHELLGRTMREALDWEPDGERRLARDSCEPQADGADATAVQLCNVTFTCKDGSRLPIALSAAPLGEGGGGPVGHVVVFHDTSDRDAASHQARRELEEMSWIGRLRDAMDEGRLELVAQPIISVASGEVSHHELLLRLRDRSGELVAPGEFLPAAERFDLIREIDRWVLGQAAALAAEGHAVNVNLSARSLGDPELSAVVERTLREAHAEPSLITFEITETSITDHPKLACRFAEDIAALGCRFALDDFGTGYGAFTYLKQLPIHYLKIDREFVHDVAENAASRHVVQALISLARGFGQQTIAEGVESEKTLEVLRELGVDHVQGYHVAPPGPVSEMICH